MAQRIYKVTHIKTGNDYTVLCDDIIECTNGREDKHYVLYTNGNLLFCREKNEFEQKFRRN